MFSNNRTPARTYFGTAPASVTYWRSNRAKRRDQSQSGNDSGSRGYGGRAQNDLPYPNAARLQRSGSRQRRGGAENLRRQHSPGFDGRRDAGDERARACRASAAIQSEYAPDFH